MEYLGHTSLQNTKKYVQIEKAILKEQNKGFVCKVAKTVDEATELIEIGFEYVNEIDHAYLSGKR
jgi:hypothetical protein